MGPCGGGYALVRDGPLLEVVGPCYGWTHARGGPCCR